MVLQFVADGLCRGAVTALVATGFGLIYSTTRVFHVAHAATCVLAAYVLFAAFSFVHLPIPFAAALSLVAAALFGAATEWLVYRPLFKRDAPAAVAMLSSLGVYAVAINTIALIFGNETRILRPGVEMTFHLGNVILTRIQIAQLVVTAVLVTFYLFFLRATSLGRTCRAVADDPVLASVLGVRMQFTRVFALAAGSVLAAAGAILSALDVGLSPQGGFPALLTAAVACLVAGLHHLWAPAIGGLLLGLLQALTAWRLSTRWSDVLTFGVLVLVLIWRPQGLLTRSKRLEER